MQGKLILDVTGDEREVDVPPDMPRSLLSSPSPASFEKSWTTANTSSRDHELPPHPTRPVFTEQHSPPTLFVCLVTPRLFSLDALRSFKQSGLRGGC